jgi:uncharacterized Zn finger protein (UPF0148 family)
MNEQVKKMAELLRSGATMLQDTCPTCNSPLFKFEGKIFCVKCGPPSAKTTEASESVNTETIVSHMTSTILRKLKELDSEVSKTTDFRSLYILAKIVLTLVRALQHLKRLGAT